MEIPFWLVPFDKEGSCKDPSFSRPVRTDKSGYSGLRDTEFPSIPAYREHQRI